MMSRSDMKRKRKEKMDNQPIYMQSNYQMPKPTDWVVIPIEEKNNLTFEENDNCQPTSFLIKSYVQAQIDRKENKASPIFSSVSEMKKWVDEQSE